MVAYSALIRTLVPLLVGLAWAEEAAEHNRVVFDENNDEVSPGGDGGGGPPMGGIPFNVDFGPGMGSGMIIPLGGFFFSPLDEVYDSIDDVHELAGGDLDKAVVTQPQQPKRLRRGVVPVMDVFNGILGQMLNQMLAGSIGGIQGESSFSMNTSTNEVTITGQLPKQTLRTDLGEEDNVRQTDGPLVTEMQRYYPMTEDCLLDQTKVVYDQNSGKLRITIPRNPDMVAAKGDSPKDPKGDAEAIKKQLDEESQRDGIKVRFGDDDTITVIVPMALGRVKKFDSNRVELEGGKIVTVPVEVDTLVDEGESPHHDAREYTFTTSEVSKNIPITNDEL
ncbi:hypothetical protein FOL47_002169 [Perkinsus chesapeaki]|uniref:Uncharacterized protein n=1 Tax=Perkinsus chesapeaki TaxID=330153 RepID=A0A7J6KS80_PERCH|nr:hypothetical protein FOL47_002169 [Perkinsus chesapeaki]